MVSSRFGDRVDRISGKAKEWTGRATGNSRLEWRGRLQSGLASAMIMVREAAKKLVKAVQQRRRR